MLCDEFELRTHRRVLGMAVHTDTQSIHFHLQFTRVGLPADGPVKLSALDPVYGGLFPADRNYLLGGRALETIGAATCSGLNMLLVGAVLPESNEYRQIQHSAFAFHERRGIAPIDWLLWKLANECFQLVFGANPRLSQLVGAYRRASVQSRLAALERVKAKVASEIAALMAQNRGAALAGATLLPADLQFPLSPPPSPSIQ